MRTIGQAELLELQAWLFVFRLSIYLLNTCDLHISRSRIVCEWLARQNEWSFFPPFFLLFSLQVLRKHWNCSRSSGQERREATSRALEPKRESPATSRPETSPPETRSTQSTWRRLRGGFRNSCLHRWFVRGMESRSRWRDDQFATSSPRRGMRLSQSTCRKWPGVFTMGLLSR